MQSNNSNDFYIEVPVQKVDGTVSIDADFLMYLMDFLKDLGEKPKQDANVTELFMQKVKDIWRDCLALGPRPWENKENIIGEALLVDYPFDPEKLESHKEEIYELIKMVHLATTYEEIKFLNTGEKWSELRQPVSFLMAIGNALNLVDFKNKRQDWSKEETKNPEITFTLTK
mgnify:FL=1